MLLKAAVLLLFAGTAIANVYRLTNRDSESSARAYSDGSNVLVPATGEDDPDYDLWELEPTEDGGFTFNNGGFTLNNVALKKNGSPNSFAAVSAFEDGAPVFTSTSSEASVFYINNDVRSEYVIGSRGAAYVWTAEPEDGNGIRPIKLRGYSADSSKRWVLTTPSG